MLALNKAKKYADSKISGIVTSNKNLFTDGYIKGIRIGGASPYAVTTDAEAISVIFHGQRGKTYTISKSNDSDYIGCATFLEKPVVGMAGNRGITSNLEGVTHFTVTLQGEEEYLLITVSSATQSKHPTWFQIEEGTAVTAYIEPITLTSVSNPKINIVKSSDNLKIYVPSKNTPNRYIRFEYARVINVGAELDTWALKTTGIYLLQNNVYVLDFMLSSESDNEGVLKIQGEADFIGGLHGYEVNEILDVIIDGNQVDMSGDFNVKCSHIKIVNKARVYHDLTTTKAFTRYKVSTWDLNSYILDGRWIAETGITVESSKLCDFSIDKINNSKNVLKWGRNDLTYEKQDVSVDFSGTALATGGTTITKQELWSAERNFYIGVSCEYDRSLYTNQYQYVENFSTRAKIYFDLTGTYAFTAGEEIRYRNIYDFVF